MKRRLPVLATLLVLAAVAAMIALGFWQLGRRAEKAALLARHAQAQAMSSDAPWPRDARVAAKMLYRHATLDCRRVSNAMSVAGRNAAGQAGLARVVDCELAGGETARIVLGWSSVLIEPDWRGGIVQGVIAPGGRQGPRLVADPPLAGLERNARPDPADLPNNHLSYAVQWFLFAATALVIYALALRKRMRGG